jgi:L-threonylcarbamoyladenylate synthase
MNKFNDFSTAKKHLLSLVREGGVIIFPTETIYGIGCSVLSDNSIRRVFEIKGRKPDQPPPVLIGSRAQLDTLVSKIPLCSKALMEKYWPGSLTLILPARDEISSLLCGVSIDGSTRTIGVRWTGHPTARVLCAEGEPLIATSANFSGATGRAAAPQTVDDIDFDFQQRVDAVIDDGAVGGLPSTIIDCTGDAPRIIREGALKIKL